MVKIILAVLLVVAATQQAVARKPLHQTKIFGGQVAEPHSIPYQVAFAFKDVDEGLLNCGGSIITEKHILTAGYCCQTDPKRLVVRAGEHKFYEDEGTEQVVEVREFYIHPEYSFTGQGLDFSPTQHDICVAELKKPLVFNKYVSAVKLPETDQKFSGEARVSGWGIVEPGGPMSVREGLYYVDIPIVSDEECLEIYGYLRESIICAGEEGKDTCINDIGGPMVCQGGVQCGITAYGYGCGETPVPRFYTKTSDYLEFITNIINYQ